MANDAAAPDGELTASNAADSTAKPTGAESSAAEPGSASSATEPESTAVELTASDESTPEAEADDRGDHSESVNAEVDETDAEGTGDDVAGEQVAKRGPMSHVGVALIAGLVGVIALAGLTGWLGFRAYQSDQDQELRSLFLQVGRQGALNLTTIDWENADADVQRILDSATGTFYDDFQQRAEAFAEVVKQAQSKSEGTIAEAGLESVSGDEGQVLVAVTVRTSNLGAPEQAPRAWRMRISVQKVDDEAKVSNVEFVP